MVSSLMLFLLLLKAVGDQDKVMSEGGTNGTVDDADLVALIEADLVEGGHHLPGLEGAQRTPIAATRALADGRRLIGEHIRVIVDLSLELLERLHAVRAAHKDVRRLGALRREEPSVEG
uniref:Secreted protein n=1 Tax=Phaeomonas parva TaxID=124430 RepID=A0A6U4DBG3_9STRA